ncbi:ActS/PrrB/RegB family redox-sensitive histidine kinase [Palleronia sediminis]|uniref:histidine kinase n=1 Tax=Palleronia sediminis TaxID=2547833 RepID=A0A4V3B987_9RHOB|nr:ActS/PrrB/RegB family redox-sensitive histidine kinase [Palleronia sediminis]TDL78289.1 ActS/PrrB/RegB family redox-sensitive histidine kinase [Palleronia sediminis]
MPNPDLPLPGHHTDPIWPFDRRTDWVRLRTLMLLRWIAITGQIAGVEIARRAFSLDLAMGAIYAVIGAAVLTNVMAALVYPETKRLREFELVAALVFDMVQLSFLLSLTGGLHNPFALLILAQVAIAATALRRWATIFVCGCALILVTGLLFVFTPLVTTTGAVMALPSVFVLGFWCAISVGIVFQAAYAQKVAAEATTMADALAATQMALAREQSLTDLGGVVAAAAHELGTPLATIAVVASELAQDAAEPEVREDARLIREQAERCRMILRSMGRAGKEDRHIRHVPISSVIEDAAEPHADRGVEILYDLGHADGSGAGQPIVARRPELIHGIRNLVQNAVDFARSQVWIDVRWGEEDLVLRITDDGPGFPPDLLPVIGDPFLRVRTSETATRRVPQYDGMGLGLFIAKTLLERSGAEVTFANGGTRPDSGATVTLVWPMARLAPSGGDRSPLGDNQPFPARA